MTRRAAGVSITPSRLFRRESIARHGPSLPLQGHAGGLQHDPARLSIHAAENSGGHAIRGLAAISEGCGQIIREFEAILIREGFDEKFMVSLSDKLLEEFDVERRLVSV